jgi:hypothetical protein
LIRSSRSTFQSDCEKAFENAESGEGDQWDLLGTHRATAMTFNGYELVSEVVGPR